MTIWFNMISVLIRVASVSKHREERDNWLLGRSSQQDEWISGRENGSHNVDTTDPGEVMRSGSTNEPAVAAEDSQDLTLSHLRLHRAILFRGRKDKNGEGTGTVSMAV